MIFVSFMSENRMIEHVAISHEFAKNMNALELIELVKRNTKNFKDE